jgi:hypothetical protein
VSLASAAAADDAPAPNPAAAQLKQQGDAAMRSMHYRDAIAAYQKAYKLQPEPAILYNTARAEQGLGDYPAALDAIDEFVRVAPEDLKQRVPKLAELVADIRSHVGFVVVICPVSGASVSVDGKVVGKTPLSQPLRVAAGDVAIGVEASGYAPFHKDVAATGGKVTTVAASLTALETSQDKAPPPPPPPRMERYVPAGWRIAAFTTGGLGLVSLAAGGVFGALVASNTSDASSHCPGKVCDPTGWSDIQSARTFATVSTATFIAGGVLVAGAAALFLFAPHASRPIAIRPLIGPGFIGIGGDL